MPLPFFGRRDDKIRRRMESYRGWSVVDGNGNELGRVASMEYRIEEGDGKIKVVITGLSVSRNGEESKYSAKDYVIKINDEERVIVVKPKNELESTINEVKIKLEETVSKLRKVNDMLLKLGDVMLNMINNNEKIPQDLIDKFRKMLENERERYIRECDERIEKLTRMIGELDARISELETEYGELKLKSEIGQLDGKEKVRLSELKDNLDRFRSIRNEITMVVYKYRGECI
jgi:predicted RNase H-like nuclease (RuvC/YqgF family)